MNNLENINVDEQKKFIGYEYQDLTIKDAMAAVYADGYESFGWTLEGTAVSPMKVGAVIMKFKRDRKIRNKAELTRLQRQFDACVSQIQALDFKKSALAAAVAYAIGVVGTALMAGSVFAITANMVTLCVILAIPAFIGWVLPYLCYRAISKKKTDEIMPLINKKYDEIYLICEKSSELL